MAMAIITGIVIMTIIVIMAIKTLFIFILKESNLPAVHFLFLPRNHRIDLPRRRSEGSTPSSLQLPSKYHLNIFLVRSDFYRLLCPSFLTSFITDIQLSPNIAAPLVAFVYFYQLNFRTLLIL